MTRRAMTTFLGLFAMTNACGAPIEPQGDTEFDVTESALVSPSALSACVDSGVAPPYQFPFSPGHGSPDGRLAVGIERQNANGSTERGFFNQHVLTTRAQSKLVVTAEVDVESGGLYERGFGARGAVGASIILSVYEATLGHKLCEQQVVIDNHDGGETDRAFTPGVRTVSCTVDSWELPASKSFTTQVRLRAWASGWFGGRGGAHATATVRRINVKRCVEPEVLTDGRGRCAGPSLLPARQHSVIKAQECTGDPSQRWELLGGPHNPFQIRHTQTGLCLNPIFDWSAPDSFLNLQPCDATKSVQRFWYLGNPSILHPGSLCRISSDPISTLCARQDAFSSAIQLKTPTDLVGPPEQQWSLHPRSTP